MGSALFISLIVLMIIGMPMALALGGAAYVAIEFFSGLPSLLTVQKFFTSIDSFPLMAIPFFMLSGSLMSSGGISDRLIKLIGVMLRKLPGGWAIVTVVACTFFGALTGSSLATVAAIGGIMLPVMLSAKYNDGFAMSCAASAGFLGIIIPPSINMVTYGVITGASVSDLFMAGIFPGLLISLGMCLFCYAVGRSNNYRITDAKTVTIKEFLVLLFKTIPAIIMPLIIMGGIYGGIFTPTEAGCVAVFYGLFVGFFVYRELKLKDLVNIFRQSALRTATILLVISGASAFGTVLTREMIPNAIANYIIGITGDSKVVFLLMVNVLLLFMGAFLEINSALMLTAPILVPVAVTLGIDLVQFGIIMIVNLAIGFITPPLGLNLYLVSGMMKKPMSKITGRYLVGFILVSVAALALISLIPPITTFLPQFVKR